jgi:hypothetical protein
MFPVGAAMATPITLSDLNATATFDFAGGGSGMNDWTVDHLSQLYQQWFWYRIGNTGPELPINSLTLDSVKVSDGNRNPGNDRVVAYYSGNGLDVSVDHVLTGGRPGTSVSDVAETIVVRNTTSSTIDFHFFQFVDLNLMNTPQDTLVQINVSGNAARQTKGNYVVAETVDTPSPSLYQADYAANIRTLLTNGGPDDLNNQAAAANGDLGWAFQWNVALASGQEFLISKDKRFELVPEPGTLALLGIGAISLLGYVWRRMKKRDAALFAVQVCTV